MLNKGKEMEKTIKLFINIGKKILEITKIYYLIESMMKTNDHRLSY